ncbi:Bug family tripartite tricarboxylate transporter substrate binding protein [Pollutimonas harenae]|uniref:Tripartite tricarboxylate transporter substrate binding protein n=1 Tax=Pollutimonas harenae TaxID=657015 RepID=A0A853GYC1_9BURK|nr:tripartite tricarboxylate transporter substrate binding protein [Pollutimonas harenae]NYT85112.1 tripartite tricarboxylate transporter substrate binding protein [Pollutimonas harenae]TEA72507.1 tripartite tricarboxylate transporter substrate binding protein [Pollutimonas harenae]
MTFPTLKRYGWTLVAAISTSAALLAPAQAADSFPTRPVTIVVPFPAGGTPDIIARVLAEKASTSLGQTIVVENKGGAGGNIGVKYVSRSKPDGYTLVMCAYSCAVAPSLYKPAPYSISNDFKAVMMVGTVPSVLVVNPQVPAKNVAQFIDYAKANPNKLNAASSGVGGSAHLALELLKREATVDIAHIPYKGAGQVAGDLLGGQVDMYFDNLPASLASIKEGRLIAIAVASKERAAAIPDVPTFAESGYPNMIVNPWFGLLAPAGTPTNAINKLNTAFNEAFKAPEVQERLDRLGVNLAGGSPDELTAFLDQETATIAQLIKENNITVE